MWKFCVSIYRAFCEFFDRFFVVVTLLIGGICLYYGIMENDGNPDLRKLLHTVGSLAIASGIFTGIAKSNQFTEIYKKILRDIIYGKEHLDVRKDLENIWENVTQALSNQKFLKISDKMKTNIKKYFLPLNHDYYYDNYNIEVLMEFSPDNPEYLILKETVTYTIICDDEDLLIDNKFIGNIKVDLTNKDLTDHSLKKLVIDNENVTNITFEKKLIGNHLRCEYHKQLKGKKSYFVKREEEKKYDMRFNPIRKQLAVWIYNNCSLDLTYPKGLNIDFHNMGVLDEFKIEDKSSSTFNRIKAEYKGLIYKNQGFFLHLRRK